jgi:hypothetical protein
MFTSRRILSIPPMISMTQISFSTIVKLQIERRHTWTPNLKMTLYLKNTWQKSELKFFKLQLNSVLSHSVLMLNHVETRSFK